MKKVISYYTNGAGKPLEVEVDVTPSWWSLRRITAYERVAALIAASPGGMFAALSLDIETVKVKTRLIKSSSEPIYQLEVRVETLMQELEALGGEYAYPKHEDDA